VSLAAERASASSAASKVFDSLIRSRAIVFDEMAARHRAAHGGQDLEITRLAKQLFSASGARLGSLRSELKTGEIIVLHRGAKKAKFRISWVQQVNPKEIQAGIEALEPRENFWGVDLTAEEREEKKSVDMLMTLLSETKT